VSARAGETCEAAQIFTQTVKVNQSLPACEFFDFSHAVFFAGGEDFTGGVEEDVARCAGIVAL